MGRWEPGTPARLRTSALELFTERGYHATTVDDIAEAAGVTQRTFFRHFADKEEVLFDEDATMEALLVDTMRASLPPGPPAAGQVLDAARAAMRELAGTFEADPEHHRHRAAVLAQVPSLQARQLLKHERWAAAVRAEAVARGADPHEAAAAVELAAGAMRLAYAEWVTSSEPGSLLDLLAATEERLDRLR